MRTSPCLIVIGALVAGACSGGAGGDAAGERVPVEVLLDITSTLPENVDGIDLGDLGPDDDLTFCDAFGTTPTRWVDDAVVPVQWWVDAFTIARSSAPENVADEIDLLLDYGGRKLDWNFKRIDERPVWSPSEADAALAIADAAVETCADLPLVAAPPERSDTPLGWADLTDDEIAANCETALAQVQDGIDWYTAEFGTPPRHQQQIELASMAIITRAIADTGDYPSGVLYVGSDFSGVGDDGMPAHVPGGACDP